MAAAEVKLCFQCDQNPRLDGDFLCRSCKEEHKLCYECGERERNYPFRLCQVCYKASRRNRQPSTGSSTVPDSSIPTSHAPAASLKSGNDGKTCMLPGCRKLKHLDESSGREYDFCSKRHAEQYKMIHGAYPKQRILIRLRADQNTYKEIAEHFRKEWVKLTPACPKPPVPIAIYAVQNRRLLRKFHKYGEQIREDGKASNSDLFFHGTKIKCHLLDGDECCSDPDCGICGISSGGFDTARIGSNIPHFKRFGHGIYLAPNSSKCHDYTQGEQSYGVRAQLLCLVACGAKYELKFNNTSLAAAPQDHHCVYGRAGGSLNYDEIVVYDADAVLPQFIVVYEHDGVDKIAG